LIDKLNQCCQDIRDEITSQPDNLIFKQLNSFEKLKVEDYLLHFTKIIKHNPEIEILTQKVYENFSITVHPIEYNPEQINTGITNILSQAVGPILNQIAIISNNQNHPLYSKENKYEKILKEYPKTKDNYTPLLVQCQNEIFQQFSFDIILDKLLESDKFRQNLEQTKLTIYDPNQIPIYLSKIFTIIAPFILRINPQSFIEQMDISQFPPNLFLEYLSYLDEIILQPNVDSKRNADLISGYKNEIPKIESAYKTAYSICKNVDAPPFPFTPQAFVQIMNQFLNFFIQQRTTLIQERQHFEREFKLATNQMTQEKQRHIHTFLAMERQYERRISVLKEFYCQSVEE
jgi:hypothetical protein